MRNFLKSKVLKDFILSNKYILSYLSNNKFISITIISFEFLSVILTFFSFKFLLLFAYSMFYEKVDFLSSRYLSWIPNLLGMSTDLLLFLTAVFCIVVGFILKYYSSYLNRYLARDFHQELVILSTKKYFENKNKYQNINVLSLITQGSLHASKFCENLVVMISLIGIIIYLNIYLLITYPIFVLFEIIIIVLSMPFQYFLSNRIKKISSRFYSLSSTEFSLYLKKIFDQDDFKNKKKDLNYDKKSKIFFDDYDALQLNNDVINLFFSTIRLITIFTVFILFIFVPDFSLSTIEIDKLIILPLILFTLTYLQNSYSYFANLVVFYPQLINLFSFLDILNREDYEKIRNNDSSTEMYM